jgi:hypothetical protein
VLLLDVRVEIEPEREHALNEWYHTHVPRLVSVPGYESGRRYIALTEGPRYAALYEIPDPQSLPSLLGSDHAKRHPVTLAEWDEWDEQFVPYMKHGSTNLYQADADFSLKGDYPIVEVRFDDGAWGTGEDSLLGLAGDHDGVVEASVLRAARDEAVRWLETQPSSLMLLQMRDDASAVYLVSSGLFTDAANAGGAGVETVAYAQIARHWPFSKEESNGN